MGLGANGGTIVTHTERRVPEFRPKPASWGLVACDSPSGDRRLAADSMPRIKVTSPAGF